MKIIELQAENVKRLKAVEITPRTPQGLAEKQGWAQTLAASTPRLPAPSPNNSTSQHSPHHAPQSARAQTVRAPSPSTSQAHTPHAPTAK